MRKRQKSKDSGKIQNLYQVLDRLEARAQSQEMITINAMMDAVGRRSFGPLILMAGLICMSPLSGIPTIPSLMGVLVVLVAGQLLIGRAHFWLPQKLLNISISSSKFCKGLKMLRPVSRFVDRLTRPRLTFLTQKVGVYIIALFCVLIGLTMPPLEILPFLATSAGIALTVYGLALIAQDGVLVILAFLLTGVIGVLVLSLS